MCLSRKTGVYVFRKRMDFNCDNEKQYIKITVGKPRTHISREKALYTDYEVNVETNNIAFSCTDSCVRRRYSDFQWLRNRLISQFALERTLPELPPKRVFGRFKKQFLKSRQKGLQIFLQDITSESTYLSDIAVHLFLQTTMSVKGIENRINGTDSGGELLEELQSPSALRGCGLSRSCSVAADDLNFDHDSGFSYSTASSLNDCLAPHSCKANYMPNEDKLIESNASRFEDNNGSELGRSELSFTTSTSVYTDQRNSFTESERKISSSEISSGNISSQDEDGYIASYDADDEIDDCYVEKNNNKRLLSSNDSSNEDEELFSFRKTSDQTVYTLSRALEIIKERPKLTDRLFIQDDSDDCFRESEYDVIDTEDDVDVVEVINDTTNFSNTSHIEIKVRSHTLEEDGRLIEVTTTPVHEKNKLKTGKVKSLPSIRFPIRDRKYKHYRSTSEVSLISSKSQLNTVYDDLILQQHSIKSLKSKSESDGQQATSDADYLTTIHRYHSNDSQVDIDTQAEDIAPTKFLSLLPRRKRRKSVTGLAFSSKLILNATARNDSVKGRFQVSTVREMSTPDAEKHFADRLTEHHDSSIVNSSKIIANGHIPHCTTAIQEADILLNDDTLGVVDGCRLNAMPVNGLRTTENFLLKSYEII